MKSLFLIAISVSALAVVAETVSLPARECAAGADEEECQRGDEWSALRIGGEIAGEDSWHGFNNAMFVVQDVLIEYGAKPLNYVYCSILPRPLIIGIDNAVDNSEYPVRFFSTLFRGEGGCDSSICCALLL